MAKVTLDALIPREDFEISETTNPGKKKDTISIEDLKSDSFFIQFIRKPDFQRETNEWDDGKIVQFVESFLNGDLIPAIILWRSPTGYIFVIDGSHRLSTLIAWINDDFGDGKISKLFYDGIIPEEQIEIGELTRKAIRKNLGAYDDFKLALSHPEKVKPEVVIRAKNLAALAIQLQWVEGDVKTAESSFFKINQQAAPIDTTELKLLEARKKPNCIAARSIIRGGKGHKYWSKFSSENQQIIQDLAKEIHQILFRPRLETPIKTLDLPIAGKLYSPHTLPLVFEFVNITNNLPANFKEVLKDDENGDATIQYLRQSRKVAQRINSVHPSSLGLHPIIYFYSPEGNHRIGSFHAIATLLLEMEKSNLFNLFTKHRKEFEEVLKQYEDLVQQISRRYRTALNSFNHIKLFLLKVLTGLEGGQPRDKVVASIIESKEFNFLFISPANPDVSSPEFSRNRKSAVFIKEALDNSPKCAICGGYIHRNSITIDHKERREDGGLGSVENGQITHPYCNTTYKN
jgi:hypothetical protein